MCCSIFEDCPAERCGVEIPPFFYDWDVFCPVMYFLLSLLLYIAGIVLDIYTCVLLSVDLDDQSLFIAFIVFLSFKYLCLVIDSIMKLYCRFDTELEEHPILFIPLILASFLLVGEVVFTYHQYDVLTWTEYLRQTINGGGSNDDDNPMRLIALIFDTPLLAVSLYAFNLYASFSFGSTSFWIVTACSIVEFLTLMHGAFLNAYSFQFSFVEREGFTPDWAKVFFVAGPIAVPGVVLGFGIYLFGVWFLMLLPVLALVRYVEVLTSDNRHLDNDCPKAVNFIFMPLLITGFSVFFGMPFFEATSTWASVLCFALTILALVVVLILSLAGVLTDSIVPGTQPIEWPGLIFLIAFAVILIAWFVLLMYMACSGKVYFKFSEYEYRYEFRMCWVPPPPPRPPKDDQVPNAHTPPPKDPASLRHYQVDADIF